MEKEMRNMSIWPGNLNIKCRYSKDKDKDKVFDKCREKIKTNKLSAMSFPFPQLIWHCGII